MTNCVDRFSGFAECYERGGNNRQTGPTFTATKKLVHSGDLRHKRGWSVRGPRLAVQPTEKPEMRHLGSLVECELVYLRTS